MKQLEINAIIEKYYKGLTTAAEEKSLKYYLENNHNAEYDTLRSQLSVMKEIQNSEEYLDNSFDEKLLKELTASKPEKSKFTYLQRTFSGVAAAILILFSIWITTNLLSPKEVYGTINDPKAAFAETKSALQKISKNVNKGVKPASSTIKKAESGIDKSKNIKDIKKLNNTGQLLKSLTKVTVKYGKS